MLGVLGLHDSMRRVVRRLRGGEWRGAPSGDGAWRNDRREGA